MSKVYVYTHSWVEDHETYGENVICVSPNLYPPSKEYVILEGPPIMADYVEVWENEQPIAASASRFPWDAEDDKWSFYTFGKEEEED